MTAAQRRRVWGQTTERRRWKGSKKEAGCSVGGFQSAPGMLIVRTVARLEPAAAGSAGSRKSEIAIATGRLRRANRKGKRPLSWEWFAFRSGPHQRAVDDLGIQTGDCVNDD